MAAASPKPLLTTYHRFYVISTIINAISIACGILVVGVYLLARVRARVDKTKPFLNRISLRLGVFLNACGVCYSSSQIWLFNGSSVVAIWLYVMMTLVTAFSFAMIGLNLNLHFLAKRRYRPWHEYLYYSLALLFPLCLSTSCWLAGFYAFDKQRGTFWMSPQPQPRQFLVKFFLVDLWIILTTLYGLVIVVLVRRKVTKEYLPETSSQTAKMIATKSTASSMSDLSVKVNAHDSQIFFRLEKQQRLSRALKHVTLYPLIPLITLGWGIMVDFLEGGGGGGVNQSWILLLTLLGPAIQGVLTMLIFFTDPLFFPSIFTLSNNFNSEEALEGATNMDRMGGGQVNVVTQITTVSLIPTTSTIPSVARFTQLPNENFLSSAEYLSKTEEEEGSVRVVGGSFLELKFSPTNFSENLEFYL